MAKTPKTDGKLVTASVLAFERKLDPSDARFSAGRWEDRDRPDRWQDVKLQSKGVRGTISNRLKTAEQDPAKLDAEIQKPNLQRVDLATLPDTADTLKVRFTLRVLPGTGTPSACNDLDYRRKLVATCAGYVSTHGWGELARRYAINIANARFLWRNRLCADAVEVLVQATGSDPSWRFDALQLPMDRFDVLDRLSDLDALTTFFVDALGGKEPRFLHVSAFARVGAGQEVFPSQELQLDKDRSKTDPSRVLYEVDGVAAMHSQKIGNALRTIDDWHPAAAEVGPIAAEVYGAVTALGRAFRQPKEKRDFYSLLDDWVLRDKVPSADDQHFVMAVLVRGGVFGEKAD